MQARKVKIIKAQRQKIKTKIAASLLSADFSKLGEEIKRIEKEKIDLLHLDVMDGALVPNISFGFPVIESFYKNTSLPLDIHLMIQNPEKYAERFLSFKPKYLSFHIEAESNAEKLKELFQKIKSQNCRAGIAVNAQTDVERIFPFLSLAGFAVVMSVRAGFGGQKFMEESLEKIKKLKEVRKEKGLSFEIEVDGGINEENASKAIEAGADIIVSGSTVFKSNNLKKTISKLRKRE